MNRVLVVDKPSGMTSHDVVARIRRSSRIRKVGHTGTLDPSATGLLIVLTGKATRLAQFFVDSEKQYRGSMLLGVATDTQDADGKTISTHEVGEIDEDAIRTVFRRFEGTIQQVPPMVSALKKNGTPLYVLARRGEEVEREARTVEIRDLRLLGFESPRVRFEVACSRGTYVRTLAADIGSELGCGAHLEELRRTRIGRFGIEEATPLDAIERSRERLGSVGLSMFEALAWMPRVELSELEEDTIATGGAIPVGDDLDGSASNGLVRLTSDGSELTAVGRIVCDDDGRWVRPIRVFVELS